MRVSQCCMDGGRRRAAFISRDPVTAYGEMANIFLRRCSPRKEANQLADCGGSHSSDSTSVMRPRKDTDLLLLARWVVLAQIECISRSSPEREDRVSVMLLLLLWDFCITIVVCAGHATLMLPLRKVTRLSQAALRRQQAGPRRTLVLSLVLPPTASLSSNTPPSHSTIGLSAACRRHESAV